ncbi:MAG: hypothetical protein HRT70_01320 [Flavobacteriaceae bacterium]|nr:hypothetical protein [Flavobacteriaceae bacterium]
MATTGVSDVASTIEKVVSALTTRTLIQQSVALNMPGVWDRSGEVRPGMDRLDMIELAELAVQNVDETGAAMTPQTITPSAAQLLLNRHKSIPFSITKRGELQSKIALVQRTVENGIRSLVAEVDDAIFAEAVANAKTTDTAAAVDGLTSIRRAAKQMDLDNVPKEQRAIAASPGFMMDLLLANNNVIRANEFGSADPIRVAQVASIYGFAIFESSSASLPDDGFLALGMESVAFARQRAVSFEEQLQVLNQRTDYTVTHLYGTESTAATNPRIYVYDPA